MHSKKLKKITALVLAGAITSTATISSVFAADEPATEVVVSQDFESEAHGFTAREDQSTVKIVNDGTAHDGDGYLVCTDRTKSWHGPQFLVDDILTPGKEYIASAWVKTPWYGTVTLSMQYTDSSGTPHYSNLLSAVSQGDWAEIADVKFSVPKNATGVYLYFECSDANVDISVDDFVITSAPVYQIQQDIPSLKDVYSPYFKFGGAMMASELASESTTDLVKKHYNSITFGNELKPDHVLNKEACLAMAAEGDDTNPQVSIDAARELLDFCRDNKIPVRGHVLVWHSQTPDWFFKENYDDSADFVTKEVMLQRMENYIKNLMELLEKEYPDVEFYAWDVVNEIWLDNGQPRTGGTQAENPNYSGWVKIFGDNSFADYAFEYARKYAPEGCKLYYNDFNEYMPDKTTAMIDMCTRLAEKGVLDGIGLQSHLDVSFPSISVYEKALKKFCETGLDVQITELDATTADTSEAGFETQAKYYSDIMDLAVKYSDNISAVVIWGTTDDKSWRAAKCPVLFNEDYTAKPCFYSIVDGLEEIPTVTTSEETTTTEETTVSDTPSETDVPSETTTNIGTDGWNPPPTDTEETTVTTIDSTTIDGTTTIRPDLGEASLLGDANGDNQVDIRDVTSLNQYLIKALELDSQCLANSDVISDGLIDISDLGQIKKYIIKLIDKF